MPWSADVVDQSCDAVNEALVHRHPAFADELHHRMAEVWDAPPRDEGSAPAARRSTFGRLTRFVSSRERSGTSNVTCCNPNVNKFAALR